MDRREARWTVERLAGPAGPEAGLPSAPELPPAEDAPEDAAEPSRGLLTERGMARALQRQIFESKIAAVVAH